MECVLDPVHTLRWRGRGGGWGSFQGMVMGLEGADRFNFDLKLM